MSTSTSDAEWPAVSDFADRFARALATAEPDRFTATMTKAKRKGRIFIDWLLISAARPRSCPILRAPAPRAGRRPGQLDRIARPDCCALARR
ncbi:hypothetical protein AB5I41_06065 [Sphingomonas sp. MMS24-JH45]